MRRNCNLSEDKYVPCMSLQHQYSAFMRSLNRKRYNSWDIHFTPSHKVKTIISSEIPVTPSKKQGTEVTLCCSVVLLLGAHNNVITRDLRVLTTDEIQIAWLQRGKFGQYAHIIAFVYTQQDAELIHTHTENKPLHTSCNTSSVDWFLETVL